jgi:hypothetical protein
MKELEIVSAQDASVDITSAPVDLGEAKGYSVQAAFSSATLGGELTLEVSVDGETWATRSGSAQTVVSGAPHVYEVEGANARFFRLFWDRSGGTGTLTAKVTIKEPSNRY